MEAMGAGDGGGESERFKNNRPGEPGGAWEESVDANYLLSVPEGLHGE
jgi:hypothetical protein